MRSNIIQLPTPAAVDQAWEKFSALGKQLSDKPTLLTDRDFMERLARAETEWRGLFNALERTNDGR